MSERSQLYHRVSPPCEAALLEATAALWHIAIINKRLKGYKMLDQYENNSGVTYDITVRHLEAKLKHYETRIQQASAAQSDYFTYDRLTTQLADARTYLQ